MPTAPAYRCTNIFAARHRIAEEGGRRQPVRRSLRGDRVWEAGPGLISVVRTRAVRDGDRFVVKGQRPRSGRAPGRPSAGAHSPTPNVGKHYGLTLLYLATSTPGLDIKAIETMDGHTVNDVFTDVVVPADNVVGGSATPGTG